MDRYLYSDDEDDSVDRLTINVGGVKFETYVTTLQNIPDTRLAWLTENVDPQILQTKEFFFDRHPAAFVHIMNFYRTGKLHAPTDICGPAFQEELQFWGIDEKQMEPCCWETFTKHREAEVSKTETHYFDQYNPELYEHISENLSNFEGPGFEDLRQADRKISVYSSASTDRECFRCNFDKIWNTLEDPHSSTLAKRFSLLSCVMIMASISAYCLNTLPIINQSIYMNIIDYVCLIFFTLEIIARVVVTPKKKVFFLNYKNWIDILSVLPSYIVLIFDNRQWVRNLVIIRILRVFRFFKLSYGLQVLLHALKASSYELTLLLLILLIPLVIFSSLVYAVEKAYDTHTKFDSIPRTFWWCIITMTTVGYGDLVPVSWPGQIIGSFCSICGILVVALPISVIGSNFSLYYAHVRARLKLPKKNRALLQGNLRGLLRQPLSLSSRDRDRKSLRRNQSSPPCRKMEYSPSSSRTPLQTNKLFDQISNCTLGSDCLDVCNAAVASYQVPDFELNNPIKQIIANDTIPDFDMSSPDTDSSYSGSLLTEKSLPVPCVSRAPMNKSTLLHHSDQHFQSSKTNSQLENNSKNNVAIIDGTDDNIAPTANKHCDFKHLRIKKKSVSNPNLSLISFVFQEKLGKGMYEETSLSQKHLSQLQVKKTPVFTKETGTPRAQRRGALALLTHNEEESDNENDDSITQSHKGYKSTAQRHLEIPSLSASSIIDERHLKKNNETNRKISMRLMTSFDDLHIKPRKCQWQSESLSRSKDHTLEEKLLPKSSLKFEPCSQPSNCIVKNDIKQMDANNKDIRNSDKVLAMECQSGFKNKRLNFKRSQTEWRTPKDVNYLYHRIKSEGDLRGKLCLVSNYMAEEDIPKESGV